MKNAEIAIKNGFECYEREVEGSIVNYENLDNAQMRIHDYFKFLKYGYDRVTDWCCWHIRRDRLSRKEAIKINNDKSGKFPLSYLGIPLEEILSNIDCSMSEFKEICDNLLKETYRMLENLNEFQTQSLNS